MNFNWPKVIDEFRKIVGEGVSFDGPNYSSHLRGELRATDRFHPWNSDGMLERALRKMPKSCDYRSLKSYWAWKNGKNGIAEALDEMLYEVADSIREYYSDRWNFAPGFRLPDEIYFKWEGAGASPKMVSRILRVAKQP